MNQFNDLWAENHSALDQSFGEDVQVHPKVKAPNGPPGTDPARPAFPARAIYVDKPKTDRVGPSNNSAGFIQTDLVRRASGQRFEFLDRSTLPHTIKIGDIIERIVPEAFFSVTGVNTDDTNTLIVTVSKARGS